jgi:hypothetical protein
MHRNLGATMGMTTRAATVCVGALLVTAAFAGPAGASRPPPKDGTGTLHCAVSGSMKFSPPLITGGTATTETIALKTALSGCTGTGDGANIKGGTMKSVYQISSNDCSVYFNPSTPYVTQFGNIEWKVVVGDKQKLNVSTIQFTSGSTSAGPPITSDQSGSSTLGSFHFQTVSAHTVIEQTASQIGTSCTPPNKGVKSLSITTGSTFQVAVN